MAETRGVIDLANVAVILSGAIVGVAYLVSPDLRRNIEIHVTNRSAWYYLGKYVERPPESEHAPGGWEGEPEGCPAPERTFYHVEWDEDRPFSQDVMKTLPGQILISINEMPTAGRDGGGPGDERFSDNHIVALAVSGRCYYVKDVERRPLGEIPGCNGELSPSIAYWAEMTYVTCD